MKKPVIITIGTHKSGVGKSTTVINLSWAFAELGYNVLVCDFDAQCNTTQTFLQRQHFGDIKTVNIGTLLTDDNLIFSNANFPTRNKNLNLIPATIQLSDLRNQLIGDARKFMGLIKKIDEPTKHHFHFIIFDVNSESGGFIETALCTSHYYIMPIKAEDKWSLDGLQMFKDTIKKVGLINPDIKLLKALITMYDQRTSTSQASKSLIHAQFGKDVFDTIIRQNTDIGKANGKYLSIFEYDRRRYGAHDYIELAKEIEKILKENNNLPEKTMEINYATKK